MNAMNHDPDDPAQVAHLLERAAAEGSAIASLQHCARTLLDAHEAKLALAQVPADVLRAALAVRRSRLEPWR